eukprot:jgi/Bigna1/62685/fgenesh1_kg.40_\
MPRPVGTPSAASQSRSSEEKEQKVRGRVIPWKPILCFFLAWFAVITWMMRKGSNHPVRKDPNENEVINGPISFDNYQKHVVHKTRDLQNIEGGAVVYDKTKDDNQNYFSWSPFSSLSELAKSITPSPTTKKYYLVNFAMFRNEGVQIEEWVTHYLHQGVEHFFLIDHGPSTDDSAKILEKFGSDLITRWVFPDRSRGAQLRAYNTYFPKVKELAEWAINADVDEYVVTNTGEPARQILLRDFEQRADYIQIPGLFFGGNGHKKQPKSVICSFTRRANYTRWPFHRVINPALTKYWIRTDAAAARHVHHAYTSASDPPRRFWSNGTRIVTEAIKIQLNESTLTNGDFKFVNNHYRVLSEEYYLKTRGTRGNVMQGNGTVESKTVLNEMNLLNSLYNDVEDSRLANATPYCRSKN